MEFTIVAKSQIPARSKNSKWVKLFDDLQFDQTIKIEAKDNRDIAVKLQSIFSPFRRIKKLYQLHSRRMHEADKLYLYIWKEPSKPKRKIPTNIVIPERDDKGHFIKKDSL
jgi:hypothetical protein